MKYSPLHKSSKSIRLISIQPEEYSPLGLACSFRKSPLAQCPPFRALSYTWGTATEAPKTLFVDGQSLLIRPNLWYALCSIREQFKECKDHLRRPILLWVDAICIDQENVAERNRQVNLMNEIFSKADSVIVWLGTSVPTIDLALEIMDDVLSNGETALKCFNKSSDRSRALLHLFRHPYWTRLWVVQEIMLAKKLFVLCGNSLHAWERFSEFFNSLRALSLSSSNASWQGTVDSILLSPANTLFGNRYTWISLRTNHAYRLRDLLTMWAMQKCQDPRDMIFGLLGLTESTFLGADYRLTPLQLLLLVLRDTDEWYPDSTENEREGFASSMQSMLHLNEHPRAQPVIEEFSAIATMVRNIENHQKTWVDHYYIYNQALTLDSFRLNAKPGSIIRHCAPIPLPKLFRRHLHAKVQCLNEMSALYDEFEAGSERSRLCQTTHLIWDEWARDEQRQWYEASLHKRLSETDAEAVHSFDTELSVLVESDNEDSKLAIVFASRRSIARKRGRLEDALIPRPEGLENEKRRKAPRLDFSV